MTFDLDSYYDPVNFQGVDTSLDYLQHTLDLYKVDMDPDYQRGHVWKDEQASLFMGFLLEGGRRPVILLNCENGDLGEAYHGFEVVDGKQRLTAALRWMNDEIPAIFHDGASAYRHECGKAFTIKRVHIRFGLLYLSRPDVLKLYIRLNRGGTVHTDAEIERVRALIKAESGAPCTKRR